jgi:hypothetical protein
LSLLRQNQSSFSASCRSLIQAGQLRLKLRQAVAVCCHRFPYRRRWIICLYGILNIFRQRQHRPGIFLTAAAHIGRFAGFKPLQPAAIAVVATVFRRRFVGGVQLSFLSGHILCEMTNVQLVGRADFVRNLFWDGIGRRAF